MRRNKILNNPSHYYANTSKKKQNKKMKWMVIKKENKNNAILDKQSVELIKYVNNVPLDFGKNKKKKQVIIS